MHTQAAFQCGLQFRTNYRVDVQRNQKIVVVAFCYGGEKKQKLRGVNSSVLKASQKLTALAFM